MSKLITKVGVGVIVARSDHVLLGKRLSKHGYGTWGFPGGEVEFGEKPEETAIRELKEETGMTGEFFIKSQFCSDLFHNEVRAEESKHYITLFVEVVGAMGLPSVLEPTKCERWEWFRWSELPEPLFAPAKTLKDSGFIPTLLDNPRGRAIPADLFYSGS